MIAQLFMHFTEYPAFKRLVWKPVYEMLAKKITTPEWQFMNYGYRPDPGANELHLRTEDEPNRYPLQLYHYLLEHLDVTGADLLEVGSGRGGGAFYYRRYFNLNTVTGLDIAGNAVDFCNRHFACPGLQFVQGNAEHLPFEAASFDVIVNVESCHAYGSVPAFLKECERVLRPGGYLLCTDLRSPEGMRILHQNLKNTAFEMLRNDDITGNVGAAIAGENSAKLGRIDKYIPSRYRKVFAEFAGVIGSKIHTDLSTGKLVYHRFVLFKPPQVKLANARYVAGPLTNIISHT